MRCWPANDLCYLVQESIQRGIEQSNRWPPSALGALRYRVVSSSSSLEFKSYCMCEGRLIAGLANACLESRACSAPRCNPVHSLHSWRFPLDGWGPVPLHAGPEGWGALTVWLASASLPYDHYRAV